jgi:hypothetical protein
MEIKETEVREKGVTDINKNIEIKEIEITIHSTSQKNKIFSLVQVIKNQILEEITTLIY